MTTNFECVKDLSIYTDSLLFDSGTCIASLDYTDRGYCVALDVRVCGEVRVYFDDELLRRPSGFPEELRELIKSGTADSDPRCVIDNNNWFAIVYDITNLNDSSLSCADDEVLEADLSTMSADDLKKLLEDYAVTLIDYEERR